MSGIKFQPYGVESPNALGVGERYHTYLRTIANKVQAEKPHNSEKQALSLAVNAIKDTAGPSGLVPTLLVFGIMPRIPVRPHQLSD